MFLLLNITANSLVSEQVDRGSIVYVLSTPTKRSAIAFTQAIETIGTGEVNTAFVWKLAVLAVIAIAFYTAGALRFQKKDLPL